MVKVTRKYIQKKVADSMVIFERGCNIYEYGSFVQRSADQENSSFSYSVDGNYGDYTTKVQLCDDFVKTSCDCPYPGKGCKHIVAALLDVMDILEQWEKTDAGKNASIEEHEEPYLSPDEIREQAFKDREISAQSEMFTVTEGDMLKGEHLIETKHGKQYTVTLHDPSTCQGHCTCPDFLTNQLGTCKHLLYLGDYLMEKKGFNRRLQKERFPFIDIFWDSLHERPRLFHERSKSEITNIQDKLTEYFDEDGLCKKENATEFLPLLLSLRGNKQIRVQESVFDRVNRVLNEEQIKELVETGIPPIDELKATLYPYQEEGVAFGLYRSAALIGDEMGLGKTLQAIVLAILKKEIFNFKKVLVVTVASLKEQWKREIEKFSNEKAVVVAGTPQQRQAIYFSDDSYFKITNYEAVLRDVMVLSRFKPDLIILDEAQRIKNFSTKTADAVKSIPRQHALVLTGTPLENKLEDVYSIIQFLDPLMLTPLWQFAADHFMLSRKNKGKILGYRNLNKLHDKLQSIVIRRRKEEVLKELPNEIVNNYYLDLHDKQKKIHSGYLQALLPLLNKKYLTPMDVRRIQEILLKMRMVCNSTYLIDRKTHISPKLKELESILEELVIQNNRKLVVFSEWTTMTFLIARSLSEAGISFVELSGKVPVKKRQLLIDEFTNNPECNVFLSTDAGGTGLNLQAADCVINFELPWNPARMNQRIGRINRIGQKSKTVNVVNLITKNSIEEKILTGIQLKMDLFEGVFDGGMDVVEFSREKRTEMLNRLREMMGEEPDLPASEALPSEEVPEDTPHYLNPKVLNEKEGYLDYTAESQTSDVLETEGASVTDESGSEPDQKHEEESSHVEQSPEKMEEVLNSGMQFIGGLMEMATGQKISASSDDGRMVKLDKTTGEVTLKFKLPGF